MVAATDPLLDRLSGTLKAVVSAAETGDWDCLEALATEFQALVPAIMNSVPPSHDKESFRRQLDEVLALHERATSLCENRMTVIEPLLRNLSASRNASTEP